MWELAGRPCGWQPRTETMLAVCWPPPANFKTRTAFIYSLADNTSNSTPVVVWKMVGKAYWRILCGQVSTKFMYCYSGKSVHSFHVFLYFNSCSEVNFIGFRLWGTWWCTGNTRRYAQGPDSVQIFPPPFFLHPFDRILWIVGNMGSHSHPLLPSTSGLESLLNCIFISYCYFPNELHSWNRVCLYAGSW